MLIKASKVIGLPVFTITDGKKIENVDDVIYDPVQNRIAALLIEKGGWFAESRVILFNDLEGIGDDAALINSRDFIKKLSDVSQNIEAIVKNDTYLTNTKIITEDGIELGRVTDIYFDSETGRVEEFEVSQGTLRNWKDGKKRIKIESLVTIGHDATIVKVYKLDESISSPENKTGDEIIQKQDLKAQEFTKKSSETASEKSEGVKKTSLLSSAIGAIINKSENKQEAQPLQKSVSEQLKSEKNDEKIIPQDYKSESDNIDMKNKLQERRKRDAVGLYLSKNILTSDDKILAREGDMVTYKLLQDAEDNGVLDQVFNNAAPHVMPMAI